MVWYKEEPIVNLEGATIVKLTPLCDNDPIKFYGKGNIKNPFDPDGKPIVLQGEMSATSYEEAISNFNNWIIEKGKEWVKLQEKEEVKELQQHKQKIIRLGDL